MTSFRLQFLSLRTLAHAGWTVTFGAVFDAPLVYGFVACPGAYGFAALRIRSIGRQRLGRLRRLLSGWGRPCWRRWWHTSVAFRDPDVGAIYESFLLSFAHSAVIRPIASPTVSHAPPPLQHAVITCKAFGKSQLDLKDFVFGHVDFPPGVAIRLPQYIFQFLLSNGRRANVAHHEGEVSLVVGGNFYHHRNFLSLSVRLSDGSRGERSRVSVESFTRLKMVRVSTHAALSFIRLPLNAEATAIQLVIGMLRRCIKTKPPSRVPASWVNKAAVTKN